MRILSEKQEKEWKESVTDYVLKKACKNSGIHTFVIAREKLRNGYQPEYMTGGEMAFIHNTAERAMMFNTIVKYRYCKYCGAKAQY